MATPVYAQDDTTAAPFPPGFIPLQRSAAGIIPLQRAPLPAFLPLPAQPPRADAVKPPETKPERSAEAPPKLSTPAADDLSGQEAQQIVALFAPTP